MIASRSARLDLDAGVHLEEVELVALDEKLDRPRRHVSTGTGEVDGGSAERRAETIGETSGGGFLDELLVPTLHRAVTLAEKHHVAVAVGHDLGFDVAGSLEIALEVDLGVAEVGVGFPLGGLEGGLQLAFLPHDFEALAAAAVCRLDRKGVAVLGGEPGRFRHVDEWFERPGYTAHVGAGGGLTGGDLVTHRRDDVRGWPDPGETGFGDGPGEMGVLGEEAVPGVHGVRTCGSSDLEDLVGIEIRLGCGRRTDVPCFVGEAHVQCVAIELGVDGDGSQAELPG